LSPYESGIMMNAKDELETRRLDRELGRVFEITFWSAVHSESLAGS
jgi:hypothetical protein